LQVEGDEERGPRGDIPLDDEFDLDEDELESSGIPNTLAPPETGVSLSDNLPL
jgi:hypothetical protein